MTKKTFYSYIALLFVILFLSLLFAGGVRAGQAYIGIGPHAGTYKAPGISMNLTGAQIKVGAYVSERAALELRYLIAWGSYSYLNLTGEAATLFLKGDLPLSDKATFYGLVGFSNYWMTAEAYGFSASMSESGLSYGGGIEFQPSDATKLGIEGIIYQNESAWSYAGVNLVISILF